MKPVIAIAYSLMALGVQAQTNNVRVTQRIVTEHQTVITTNDDHPCQTSCTDNTANTTNTANDRARRTNAFSHFDGTVSLGTTGIDFEVSTPLGRSWALRGGFDFWPHFHHDMQFPVTVGENTGLSEEEQESRFNKMASTLYDVTGYKVDNKIVMEGVPKMYNFKLLVDFKPLRNKNWYLTAGFYWGNAKIATAENAKEDMTSLFSMGMYNHLWNCAANSEPYITVNDNPIYLPADVEDKLLDYGRMSIHIGDYKRDIKDAEGNVIHKKGDHYNMEPDENSMVSAKMKVNAFRPYLGIGYMGALNKKYPKWKMGFDCGALFWGGTPSIKTHDGTDLINDLTNLRHSLKKYIDLAKQLKVFPVINFKVSKTL